MEKMKKLYIISLIALAATIIGLAWAEQMTFSTYYPAPAGVYNQMVTRCLGVGDQTGDGLNYNDAPDPNDDDQVNDLWVAGSVGIGTTAPSYKLDVYGAAVDDWVSHAQIRVSSNESYDASPKAGIAFGVRYNSAGAVVGGSSIQGYKLNSIDGNFATGLLFTTQEDGQPSYERVTIAPNGNVGIGTINPQERLHITRGTVANKHYSNYLTAVIEETNNGLQIIGADATTGMSHIIMTGVPPNGDNKHWIISHLGPDLNNVFSIGYKTSSSSPFVVWDARRDFNIDTNGNVGIGTTTIPNILTVMQGSATDPIADDWDTYTCDRAHKEIIRTINPHGFLDRIIAQPLYEWKRKTENPEKAKLPKFTSTRVGMMVDDKETPQEILIHDTQGEVEGISLLAYIGYLHATIKEAALEIQNLKVEVDQLKGNL